MSRSWRAQRTAQEALTALAWPADRAAEAIAVLAVVGGLRPALGSGSRGPQFATGAGESMERRLERAAEHAGVDLDPVSLTDERAAPVLLTLGPPEAPALLAVARWNGRRALVVPPEGGAQQVQAESVLAALVPEPESERTARIESLLEVAGAATRRHRTALATLGGQRSGEAARVWALRPSPAAPFLGQARRAGLVALAIGFVAAHAVQFALWLASWWVLGRAVLAGTPSAAALGAWAGLLAAVIPVRLLASWLQGRLALGTGRLLRRRLLVGALAQDPDQIRHQGTGQLLGRVIDAETVEDLALSGGLLALVACIELVFAGAVLAAGPGGALRVGLLVAWAALAVVLTRSYLARRLAWTEARLSMTHHLVERMVGHRTRLVQQPPEHWHDGEADQRAAYLGRSAVMDRRLLLLRAGLHRGWLVVGLAAIAVQDAANPAQVAVTVGGVLLAFRVFHSLGLGLADLAGAAVAWHQVTPLFRAAARPVSGIEGNNTQCHSRAWEMPGAAQEPVVEARDVSFVHSSGGEPVLDGCTLAVGRGDRVLLEGPSGGGKSTFAAVLAGLREPSSGSVVRRGQVVLAPQFHENYVLLAPLVVNLLLGRGWPASPGDIADAETVCQALGLGRLLDRMPAGLAQIVGETGWQLSHGERSLVYVARTLLQGGELVVVDESFGALDPLTLSAALPAALERVPALFVIRQ